LKAKHRTIYLFNQKSENFS